MLLEGQVDWTLTFAVLAAIGLASALIATFFAVRNGHHGRHASTRLDRAHQTAAQTDKRLYEILTAIPVALVQTDTEGRFTFANRAAHQLLGRRDVELLGLRFHSATWGITFPDGRPISLDMLPSARALRGQTVKGFQHLMANPSTRRRMLVSATAMPIVDDQGRITGSTAALVEIEGLTLVEPATSQDLASANLTGEDTITSLALDAIDVPLVILNRQGVVIIANQAAVDRAMGPFDEGDFVDGFVDGPGRAGARETLAGILAGSPDKVLPFSTRDAAGHRMAWRIQPLVKGEEKAKAFLLTGETVPGGTGPDTAGSTEAGPVPGSIADRTDSTAAADESRRLEEVGRLSAGLAQDFGGLLAVMTSSLEIVSEQAAHPDKVRRLAGAALKAGRRGEVLTRQIAALASGETPLPDQPVDAAVLLRALEGRLVMALAGSAREARSRPCDLMIIAPKGPTPVHIDPAAFEAAVAALVLNAAQAGAISVSVELQPSGEGISVTVRDDGSGMDEETRRRAAEPFFTTRPGLAGLGLTQARAFARRSGGELGLSSGQARGTEVRLDLPGLKA